jgi:hypothetical protein
MYSQYNIIVIVIVIILILWFINRLTSVQHFKDRLCVNCSGGSNILYIGVTANVTGCNCNYNFAYTGGSCIECIGRSNTSNTGGRTANVVGCYCPYNNIWNQTMCITCIGGSNLSFGGLPAYPNGCFCDTNNAWIRNQYGDGIYCIQCTGGSNLSYGGSTANATGCFCPLTYIWSGTGCIMGCPTGSSGSYTGQATNMSGCYCPDKYTWDGQQCYPCYGGSDYNLPGPQANYPGCFCPSGQDWNSSSYKCVSGCVGGSSGSYSGTRTNNPYCFCPTNNYVWENSNCILCAGNSTPTQGGPSANASGCHCPNNTYSYSSSKDTCIVCLSSGASATYQGPNTNNPDGCNCQSNQYPVSNSCATCPANSSLLSDGPFISTLSLYCKCNYNAYPGIPPNYDCILCPGNSIANSATAGNTYDSRRLQLPNNTKCACPLNLYWDINSSMCITCPTGSTTDTNTSVIDSNQPTNISSCKCLRGYKWDGNKCVQQSVCPGGSTGTQNTSSKIQVPNRPDCWCDNSGWNSNYSQCLTCSVHSNYNKGVDSGELGCYCDLNSFYSKTEGICKCFGNTCTLICPTGSEYSPQGNYHPPDTVPTPNIYCVCPVGNYGFDSAKNACVVCPTNTYKFHDNSTDQSNVQGCYCRPYYKWINNSCQCISPNVEQNGFCIPP